MNGTRSVVNKRRKYFYVVEFMNLNLIYLRLDGSTSIPSATNQFTKVHILNTQNNE